MITLTGSELTDLKTEVDIADVWNDVRVMLPSYETTLELLEDGWHRYPVEIVARATDGPSISQYGRRTKTQSKHVIEQYFAESYCEGEVAKYKEPVPRVEMKVIGSNAANVIMALSPRVARQVAYQYSPLGLNAIGAVDTAVLDVDLDGIPRLTLSAHEISAQDLLEWFHVGIDTIDNETDVIG
jgi:hypothetical protein